MKYSDIEDAFMFVSMSPPDEHYAYLNKETGEAYYVSSLGGSDELPDDLEANEKYIDVPHKNDLNLGRNLVFDFISANLPNEFERVRGIFSSRNSRHCLFYTVSRLAALDSQPFKGGIMKNREEYIDKLAAQLKEWFARIDEVEIKARTARVDVKAEYENQIRQLKDKRDAAAQKLQELKSSSADAWDTLKAGAETAWAELKSAVTAAKEKFKKPGERSS